MKTGIYWQDPKYRVGWTLTDPSCVLYLPLHRLDGASFMSKDTYGHLCVVTGALWTPRGRSFDGSDDYVDCGNAPSLDITGDKITLEAWVRAAVDGPGWSGIIRKQDENAQPYFIALDDNQHFRVRTQTPGGVVTVVSPLTYNDDEWHYLVGTYNGVEQFLYVDGVEVASNSQSGNLVSTPESLKIGAGLESAQYFFKGGIDEVKIHRGLAINALRVQRNYLATKWRYQ